jgi:serine/threonine-protein kinase
MELIAGNRVRGPLPVETVLQYAKQIAEALEAAHDKGIVHRDLKPANILVTSAGMVKVLDFGLAAVAKEPVPGSPDSNERTLSMGSTRAGVIMGSAGYMAPEQARGQAVDKRADIWSFGVVLYEMLTGKSLFGGATITDSIAAILTRDPDLTVLPHRVRRLLQKCLEKDPKKRLRDIADWHIGDARIVIDECLANPGTEEAEVKTAAADKKPGVWIGAAGALAIALTALAWVHFRENPAELPVLRFPLGPPDGAAFGHETFGAMSAFAVSPDGRRVAFVAHLPGSKDQLWLRPLGTFAAQPLPGTEGASYPF